MKDPETVNLLTLDNLPLDGNLRELFCYLSACGRIAPLTDIPHAKIVMGAGVMDTSGRKALKEITLTTGQKITTDCLAVSGGWNPNVHLTCHQRGRPSWAEDINAFVPGKHLPPGMQVVGAAQGDLTLSQAMSGAHQCEPLAQSLSPSQPRMAGWR